MFNPFDAACRWIGIYLRFVGTIVLVFIALWPAAHASMRSATFELERDQLIERAYLDSGNVLLIHAIVGGDGVAQNACRTLVKHRIFYEVTVYVFVTDDKRIRYERGRAYCNREPPKH